MTPENEFHLASWSQAWDEEIERWERDPNGYWAGHPLSRCYAGKGASAAQPECLPEPYLGDPLQRHSVVFLNLNPGPPCSEFQGPSGLFTDRVRKVGYSRWAKCLPYNPVTNSSEKEVIYGSNRHKGGEDFWGNRNRWVDEITGYVHCESDPSPFCIELFPFHSHKWGRFDLDLARGWIEEWVLKPAACLAGGAEIPVVMCVGKSFERFFLETMRLTPECRFSSADDPVPANWPLKDNRYPVNRSFSKFRIMGGTFVVTWHCGGNKLPGTIFKEICKRVIFG